MANDLPVQKLRNLIEKIRDKESRIASRHCEFSARYEGITSSSTRHLRPPCALRCMSQVEAMIHIGPKCGCPHDLRAATDHACILALQTRRRLLGYRLYGVQ